ncbi:MAG: GerMN domain-containing protein [Patescibacteria group bacterium]|nr:GerMN domain-containing protein [Patescibacteria group bacterium]
MIKAKKIFFAGGVLFFFILVFCLVFFGLFTSKAGHSSLKSSEGNIIVNFPSANETVSRHLLVEGVARVFENQFNWSVLNVHSGVEIASGAAYANSQDVGLFGPFKIETILPDLNTDRIILRVFDKSPKDGSIIDLVEVPLNFNDVLTDVYQIYFLNKNLDPQMTCLKVFPVLRTASADKLTLKEALNLLLNGLTDKEKEDGYVSNIPENVRINYIKDEGSIVKVDFSKDIENGVAGSCRVTAIKAQIYWTVISFDKNARRVIISVDGNTDNVLQP